MEIVQVKLSIWKIIVSAINGNNFQDFFFIKNRKKFSLIIKEKKDKKGMNQRKRNETNQILDK